MEDLITLEMKCTNLFPVLKDYDQIIIFLDPTVVRERDSVCHHDQMRHEKMKARNIHSL